jgi:hypothetical protein
VPISCGVKLTLKVQASSSFTRTSISYVQVIKNLVYLGKVLYRLHLSGKLRAATRGEKEGENRQKPVPVAMDRLKAFEQRTLLLETDGPGDEEEEEGGRSGGVEARVEVIRDFEWLIRRMSRLASLEAGHSPKESIKVTGVGDEVRT